MNKHSSIHVALSLSLVALSAGMSRDAFAGTAAGKVRVPTQVSVFDFGAKGDGATDDTVAIQAAINYLDTLKPHLVSSSGTATAPGTGGVVVMPPGVYYVAGPLLIGNSVTLKGSFTGPHSGVSLSGTMVAMGGGVKSNALSSGTVLLTNYGAGDPTSSQLGFINLGDSATLDGVTILYQRPNADDTSHYQWTIKSGFGVDPSNPNAGNIRNGTI